MGLKGELLTILQNTPRTVRRAARAAGAGGDWSPAADFNIFTITGGPVKVTGMFGHVVAVFAGANAIPLISFTPAAVGGVPNPMAVVAVAAAFALDTLLVWDGSLTAVTGVLRATANLGHNQIQGAAGTRESFDGGAIDCIPGIISIVNAGGAADATGQVDWYITYIPLTPASLLVAVP